MPLHFYQPTEPGLEELGRIKPNGAMMYLGANEVSRLAFSFYGT